ncbi:MAG: sensor histidine kinase, partial [Planctomycetes bacterium]|nr:sensor histidine kinase [Planctomycetota bacterium]
KESQNRIRSMALVHEKLYQAPDLALIDFDNYLRSLTATIFRSYYKSGIELIIEAQDTYLDVNTAIPCGLIINELVSNALKYAFPKNRPGRIHITFRRTATGIFVLTFQDDGIGFPEEIDFRNTESLGLQLVNLSTKQLQGDIELRREQGTTFTITFPEKETKA